MQKLLYSLLLLIFSQIAFSQQNRFIYIQTENKQPFYVKLDKKVFSSASSGYVIIPKLVDGTYNLSIGFPKNQWPAQNIQCTIDKKDVGYLLKNFGEKGWGLFNLQTLDVLMALNSTGNADNVVVKETQTDAFSNMLSDVVNDPSIKQSAVIVKPTKPTVIKEDVVITAPQPPVVNDLQSTTIQPKIKRALYNSNADGTEMIYIDMSGDKEDTIRIFIPAEKTPVVKESTPVQNQEVIVQKEIVKQDDKNVAKEKFLEIQLPNPNATVDTGQTVTVAKLNSQEVVTENKVVVETKPVTLPISVTNGNCKAIATDEDFLKLRKKMAAADSEDDMVVAAKKIFKTKCFSTEQVKNLSFLFLKDDGKYQFFDAVYPYVTDQSAFETLQNQLKEEYYINRFKVMIH
ncbi:DUF4476 domain-containing protein [Ferruginibacter lapsinanis]|uniref:DUF4476 domain-containing protein n=1 Tax=Ferruginibacter lapsinanis TaxID=563172 RepID=UPI001E64839F|nr:DUF4476 domain-containing protein [Ferruginibacter lapsinanis]UEG51266.1 DUF4476 domain-containing protein [Ferruginibacter lapsinanis]